MRSKRINHTCHNCLKQTRSSRSSNDHEMQGRPQIDFDCAINMIVSRIIHNASMHTRWDLRLMPEGLVIVHRNHKIHWKNYYCQLLMHNIMKML